MITNITKSKLTINKLVSNIPRKPECIYIFSLTKNVIK